MKYFRPTWVCGRYNKEKHAAIVYNCISGTSFFLEDDSADVVSNVLAVNRNESFDLRDVAKNTNTAMESLLPFFKQMEQLGIVSSVPITEDIVTDYRTRQSQYNCQETQNRELSTKEKLPVLSSNAEVEYMEKVGGVTSVMFELTYNCSERCLHCYNPGATRNDSEKSGRAERQELTIDDYRRIIDELYEEGLIKVCLSGGDPFSKPEAWDIIQYLYDKDIAFDIFTNGQRLTADIKRLADYFPRLVGVSLYSGCAEEHDRITRVKGSWTKSMEVIKGLSAMAIPMHLKCCIMRPNLKHYYQIAQIAKQYGAIPQFEVSVTDSVEGDKCVSKYLRLKPEQLEVVLRDDNVHLYVGPEAPNYGEQVKNMNDNGCGSGKNSFSITPDGLLLACCSLHAPFGNLKKQSVRQILESSQSLIAWRNLKLSDFNGCGRKEYCGYCNLCPGLNYSEHGVATEPAENCCYLAKVRYNLACKLKLGKDPLAGKTLSEALEAVADARMEYGKIKREMGKNFCDNELNG